MEIYVPDLSVPEFNCGLFYVYRQKKKYKPKRFIRDSDKMEWEKTGVWNGEKLLVPNGNRRKSQRKSK